MMTFSCANDDAGTITRAAVIAALNQAREVLIEALATREILSATRGTDVGVLGPYPARIALELAA